MGIHLIEGVRCGLQVENVYKLMKTYLDIIFTQQWAKQEAQYLSEMEKKYT